LSGPDAPIEARAAAFRSIFTLTTAEEIHARWAEIADMLHA
jgi:hypothetical protein